MCHAMCLCSLPFPRSATWKPVGYVEVSGSSTNVEEAARSSYRSNERRRGSDGFNATAVAVGEKARSDFHRQYAVGGDDPRLKRRGRSISPILATHSLLSTTDFLSCLSWQSLRQAVDATNGTRTRNILPDRALRFEPNVRANAVLSDRLCLLRAAHRRHCLQHRRLPARLAMEHPGR